MRSVLHVFRAFRTVLGIVFLILLVRGEIGAQSGRIREKTQEKPSLIFPRFEPKPKESNQTDQDDVIRIESVLVPIPVSVRDKNGNFVSGLRVEDFLLEDGGQRVEIKSVSMSDDVPLRIALLFDNSSSIIFALDFEKKAAISFLEQVLRVGKDSAALFSISTVGKLEYPLTDSLPSLISALENLKKPSGATALFDTVIQASEYLKNFDGKRVILVISDGDDNVSDASLGETIEKVLKNNCVVYVVMTSDFENFKRTGQRGKNSNTTFLIAERRMQKLSSQTGGDVYFPVDESEMRQAFSQIAAEISQQYILNYYPDVKKLDGSLRSLSVSVKNRSDLIVRFRKSYYVSSRN